MVKTEIYLKNKQLSDHFALSEFKCKVSNIVKYSEETIALLEKMFVTYTKIGKAIITSGYRTPDYSVKIGGSKDDAHTIGLAVDVKWYDIDNNLIDPEYIACAAQDIGFTGIGLMKNSIHLDTRTTSNYKNGKWWGDERNDKNNITNFYTYCNLTTEQVNKKLGKKEEKISITYQVWADVKNQWLPNVKDAESAGVFGQDICALYANLSKGDITYAVHDKKKKRWLPAVTNRKDYAGIFNSPIDGIMLKTNTNKTIHYRVHLRKQNRWLSYVTGYNTKDHNNGYAGIIGQEIDAIQIYID